MKGSERTFLLHLTRTENGHLRATLRLRGKEQVQYFADIEALSHYLRQLEVPRRPRGLR